MVNALLVGDVHISDRPPVSRTQTYKQDILNKLQFCVEKANELNVPLIQNGDIFHIKAPSRNSHRLVQETHEVLKETNQGVWIVPGNHDLAFDRLDSLDSQPLGALCRMQNVNLLIGETDDLPGICGIPYITEYDGGDWRRALYEYNNFDMTEPELVVTHAPIFPDGQEPGVYSSISASDFAEYFIGVPACNYGHIHTPHFTYTSDNGLMEFANYGSLSRGSLHEETVNRQIRVAYWNGTTFESFDVPMLPSEEVFLFEQAAVQKANKINALEFAQVVGSVQLDSLTLQSVRGSLATQVSRPKVLSIIDQALETTQ